MLSLRYTVGGTRCDVSREAIIEAMDRIDCGTITKDYKNGLSHDAPGSKRTPPTGGNER